MTKVLSETLEPGGLLLSIGALSGPSFALEVAHGQPTALTVAFSDPQVAALIQQEFSSETLRLYTSLSTAPPVPQSTSATPATIRVLRRTSELKALQLLLFIVLSSTIVLNFIFSVLIRLFVR